MFNLFSPNRTIKKTHNAKNNISFNIGSVDWNSFDDEVASYIKDIKNTLTSIPYDYIDPNHIEES